MAKEPVNCRNGDTNIYAKILRFVQPATLISVIIGIFYLGGYFGHLEDDIKNLAKSIEANQRAILLNQQELRTLPYRVEQLEKVTGLKNDRSPFQQN